VKVSEQYSSSFHRDGLMQENRSDNKHWKVLSINASQMVSLHNPDFYILQVILDINALKPFN